jgi:hypothetical protein
MMNPEIKKKWLEGLRNKKYKQGQGALCRAAVGSGILEYCCLGVLCDVIDSRKWQIDPRTGLREYVYNTSRVSSSLPCMLSRDIGLRNSEEFQLIEMNDQEFSFEEIAKWIEENL